MANVIVDGQPFNGTHIKTPKTNLLLIQGGKGFLGCAYFNVAVADRAGDAVALVTGVSTLAEMLDAEVVEASEAAKRLGVAAGMSGREALAKLA